MLAGGAEKDSAARAIRCTLPNIKEDIPIVILFRALGQVQDSSIIEHICYDPDDQSMMELLRGSLEEGYVIRDKDTALDFIGKRGAVVGAAKAQRVEYARGILLKELLPHIGMERMAATRKAYFIG